MQRRSDRHQRLALSTTFTGRAAYLCAMARPRMCEEPRPHAPWQALEVTRRRMCEEPRLAIAIRLPTSLHLRLRSEVRARQVSANLLVEQAIADFLDQLPSQHSTSGQPGD